MGRIIIYRPISFLGYWILLILGIKVVPYVIGPLQLVQLGGVFMVALYIFLFSAPAFLYLNALGDGKYSATWIIKGLVVGILWAFLAFATMYLKSGSAQLSLFLSRLGALNPFNNTDEWIFYLPMIVAAGLLAGITKSIIVARNKRLKEHLIEEASWGKGK